MIDKKNPKYKELIKYSDPYLAQKKAFQYLGYGAELSISSRSSKKYMIFDPINQKYIHFGSFNPPLEDFTKHKDENRRKNYLLRATNIKGNWKLNPYSPNNLAIHILW